MPMLAEPGASETSVKTGLALGKLFPTLTVSLLPFTAIMATPPLASVRAEVCGTEVLRAVWAGGDEVGGAVLVVGEVDEPVGVEFTCWTKGSLPAKVSKE